MKHIHITINQKTMKKIILPIKKHWFDLIKKEIKHEEYREMSERNISLFQEKNGELKQFDVLELRNGYGLKVPRIERKIKNISIGTGRKEWGAMDGEKYFVIKLHPHKRRFSLRFFWFHMSQKEHRFVRLNFSLKKSKPMPIKPENKKRYPENWAEIRAEILKRAKNKCEFCGVENYKVGYWVNDLFVDAEMFLKEIEENENDLLENVSPEKKPIKIILTIAHLNHTPEDNAPENLRALCQRCHNRHDSKHRAETRKNEKFKNQLTINF